MGELVKPLAEWSAAILEAIGIALIVIMALYAILISLWRTIGRAKPHEAYESGRQTLGRGILFGLEFLVAADIINPLRSSSPSGQ